MNQKISEWQAAGLLSFGSLWLKKRKNARNPHKMRSDIRCPNAYQPQERIKKCGCFTL